MAAPRKTRTAPEPDQVPAAATDDTEQPDADQDVEATEPAKRRRRFISPLDGAPIGYVGNAPLTADSQPVRKRRFGAGRTEI